WKEGSTVVSTTASYTFTASADRTLIAVFAFSQTAKITIPSVGAASPYPSIINVTGLNGLVSKVTVQVRGLTHTFPHDIGILLVSPDGRTVLIMSDAGGGNPISGVNLTFTDDATTSLPASSTIVSGSYRPSSYNPGDRLPAPAPSPTTYGSALSVFN